LRVFFTELDYVVSLFPEFFDSNEADEETAGKPFNLTLKTGLRGLTGLLTLLSCILSPGTSNSVPEDDVNRDDLRIDEDNVKPFVHFDVDGEEWKSKVGPGDYCLNISFQTLSFYTKVPCLLGPWERTNSLSSV